MAIRAYEWNRLNTYRSLVPMQHLCWQVARALRFTDQKLFNLIKGVLIRSLAYSRMVADYAEKEGAQIKFQSRIKNEGAHYCHSCEVSILIFVSFLWNVIIYLLFLAGSLQYSLCERSQQQVPSLLCLLCFSWRYQRLHSSSTIHLR